MVGIGSGMSGVVVGSGGMFGSKVGIGLNVNRSPRTTVDLGRSVFMFTSTFPSAVSKRKMGFSMTLSQSWAETVIR